MSANDTESPSVIHNQVEHRFEVNLGEFTAYLSYEIRNDDIIFIHTETPPQFSGKGVGSLLARTGLEYAKENLLRVVPICSFVEAYISRHPEYKPLVRK